MKGVRVIPFHSWVGRITVVICAWSFAAAHAFAAYTGWAVGNGGTILHTTNGGATWTPQVSGDSGWFRNAVFLDNLNGWVAGSSLRKTTDGGNTWIQVFGPLQPYEVIDFVTPLRGTVVSLSSSAHIQSTVNGGTSWQHNAWVEGPVWALDMLDQQYGWAVADARIYGTTNGGLTWGRFSSSTIPSRSYRDVCFINRFSGWAIGLGGTVLRTSNGGSSWALQTSGTFAHLYSVDFTDALNGWIVGDNGTILHTTNGGATWTPQLSGTTQLLLSVDFADVNSGWAVGAAGTIFRTVDGGNTWSAQISGTAHDLTAVSFVPEPSAATLLVLLLPVFTCRRRRLRVDLSYDLSGYAIND